MRVRLLSMKMTPSNIPSMLSYVIILFHGGYSVFQSVCYKPDMTYMPDSPIRSVSRDAPKRSIGVVHLTALTESQRDHRETRLAYYASTATFRSALPFTPLTHSLVLTPNSTIQPIETIPENFNQVYGTIEIKNEFVAAHAEGRSTGRLDGWLRQPTDACPVSRARTNSAATRRGPRRRRRAPEPPGT